MGRLDEVKIRFVKFVLLFIVVLFQFRFKLFFVERETSMLTFEVSRVVLTVYCLAFWTFEVGSDVLRLFILNSFRLCGKRGDIPAIRGVVSEREVIIDSGIRLNVDIEMLHVVILQGLILLDVLVLEKHGVIAAFLEHYRIFLVLQSKIYKWDSGDGLVRLVVYVLLLQFLVYVARKRIVWG